MNKGFILAAIMAAGLVGCEFEHGHQHGNCEKCCKCECRHMKKEADEVEMKLDELPPAVKATIVKETAAGKLGEITRESEDGKTVYSAEYTAGPEKREVTVAADGTLIKNKLEKDEKEHGDKHDKDD